MMIKRDTVTQGASMPKKSRSDNWYAWTLVAIAALVFTNAGWYYRWKVRQAEHIEALNARIAAQPKPEPRVVYEYRQAPERPASPQSHRSHVSPSRDLAAGEECRGGVIVRRSGNAIESTGERRRQ